MQIDKIIERELRRKNGNLQIVKVPASQRPQTVSLKELDDEITVQVRANEAMSNRSAVLSAQRAIM